MTSAGSAAIGRVATTTGLALAAVGLSLAALLVDDGRPKGVVVLVVGVAAVWLLPARLGAALALTAAVTVGLLSLSGSLDQLVGSEGIGVAAARALEVIGLMLAIAYAGHTLRQEHAARLSAQPDENAQPRARRRRDLRGPAQILGLLALSGIGAELLTAYDDTTGNPGAIMFALVFFGGLYGAPALLMRELARRNGWGWPSMLMLALALGVMQACVIDQSLFSTDYLGIEDFEKNASATMLPWLGVSAFNAYNFVIGHVIFSFCAPVAIAEAWRPERARSSWLGPVGIIVAAAAYLLAAVMIAVDPESQTASAGQLAGSVAVVALAIAGAWWLGVRPSSRSDLHAPRARRVLAIAFLLALITGFAEETWTGLVVGLTGTAAAGLFVLVLSRRQGWSPAHTAAAALAFLLVRGLLAFTYFPLVGEVEPFPKYAHNTVMLTLVVAAGWLALRRPEQLARHGRQPVDAPGAP